MLWRFLLLGLSWCSCTQGGLPEWAGTSSLAMANLSSFECRKCGLSGPLPNWGNDQLCDSYLDMERFDVSGNAFTGPIPESMKGWGSLLVLDVSGNKLTDVLTTPRCITLLKELRLARNNLTGPPPQSEWASAPSC